MFEKRKGFTLEHIQGLDCWIPPVGKVWDYLFDDKLVETGVFERSVKKSEQYWERTPLIEGYDRLLSREKLLQESNPDYVDSDLEAFRRQEWFRRINGYWFMNNGVPTYVTGFHYFYLNYWKIDIGYPDYREPDRKKCYFLTYCVQDPDCGGVLEIAGRGMGKCFGKGTKIRMYDGSVKKVEEINEGELVMGNDSGPRVVSGVTTGTEEMFQITPHKGDSFTCNRSHILSLHYSSGSRNVVRGWEPKTVVKITIHDYLGLKDWEREHLTLYRGGWGDHFKEWEGIDPYLLGVFLGDGCEVNGVLSIGDKEVHDGVSEIIKKYGCHLKHIANYDYRVKSVEKPRRDALGRFLSENKYITALRDDDVWQNKHIPVGLLNSSRKDRLELLAGLIDSDGYLDWQKGRPHHFEITQKRKSLAKDIVELARSLGFYVSIRDKKASMKRSDGTIYKSIVSRVRIYGELHHVPCKIDRKKSPEVHRRVNSMRTGFKIKSVGVGDYYGFAVDKNNLFLLDDGTVVHNTYMGTCFLYEGVSRVERMRGGIQSKTGKDAKETVFSTSLVEPFQHLPEFFVPVFDTSKGLRPISEMRFVATTRKGKSVGEEEDSLFSVIDYTDSGERAYDGKKLYRYLSDEYGKYEEGSITERHRVIKYCIFRGGYMAGRALYTTTVEDLKTKDNLRQVKELWDGSDVTNRNDNNQTNTYLYRYFTPAYETFRFDKYGFPDISGNKKHFLNIFKEYERKGDLKGLGSEKKKNPFTIRDVFESGADNCLFDPIMLNKQRSDLIWQEPEDLYDTGGFHWENNEFGGKVYFRGKKNGRVRIRKIMGSGEVTTNKRGDKVFPNLKHKFAMGVDPFDYKTFIDGKMSMGCAYVFCKEDVEEAMFSEALVCEYYGRPTPNAFFEDMLKMALYYGCNILVESNKTGLIQWFDEKGFGHLLTKMPGKKDPGVPSSEPSKQMAVEIVEDYFVTKDDRGLVGVQKIPFAELLQDALDFDIRDTEKYDRFMAFMWTLFAARRVANKVRVGGTYRNVSEYFKTYGR